MKPSEMWMIVKPERELDALVARTIFGIKKVHYEEWDAEQVYPQIIRSNKPWRTHKIDAEALPEYAANAGWAVVQKLCAGEHDHFSLHRLPLTSEWEAYFQLHDDREGHGRADNPSRAICLAALATYGVPA